MVESFKIKDRVTANIDFGPVNSGTHGTIICILGEQESSLNYGVSWDNISGGHNLDERLDNNSGYYVSLDILSKINSSIRVPSLTGTQINRVNEVFKSGIINQGEKNRQLQEKEEKMYMNYFNKVKEGILSKIKLLYIGGYKIGEKVKTNKLAERELGKESNFVEGIIVRKKKGLKVDVLVYKINDDCYERSGTIKNYSIKYLSHIKKTKCTLKFLDKGRLFTPKVTMTMNAVNIKGMIKNITNMESVESCSLIKASPGEPNDYLCIITKELIFEYKKKKYNYGKYEFKIVIPKKRENLNKNNDGLIDLSNYVLARRVDGAFRMSKESSSWYHNPYISDICISHYDIEEGTISAEQVKEKSKQFSRICFGAGYRKAEEAYKTKDYYALTEVTIGNLLSTSNAGFISFDNFLPHVPLVKKGCVN